MSIICDHVLILELRKPVKFWVAAVWQRGKCTESPHLSVVPVFLISDMHVRNSISSLYLFQLVTALHKISKIYAILVYMNILTYYGYIEEPK